jgi:hypothetical protein
MALSTGKIDDDHAASYRLLYNTKTKKRDNATAVQKSMEASLSTHNTTTASVLDAKRRKTGSQALEDSITSTLSTVTGINTLVSFEGSRSVAQSSGTSSVKNYLQLKVHDGSNASVESRLTMAIADMIHSCGLPFSLSSNMKFRRVLNLARNVPTTYRPPGRNQLATELLDINYDTYMDKNREKLCEDIEIFGLSFYGDGATVRKMPLINILASGGHIHTSVMEIVMLIP